MGVGQPSNGGSKEVDQIFQIVIQFDVITFFYIFQIRMGKKVVEIGSFLLLGLHQYYLRQSAVGHIF